MERTPEESRAILSAARRRQPLPRGEVYLRFPSPNGRIGWSGRREYELELLAGPGDLAGVRLLRDGELEQELDGLAGAARLPLTIVAPFFGAPRYRIEIRTVAGELVSYEFRLGGTLTLDAGEWLEEPRTLWKDLTSD